MATNYLVNEAWKLLRSHRFADPDAHHGACRIVEIIERMDAEDRAAIGDLWLISLQILIARKGTAAAADVDAA
jgi:hypothetical protein